jgi:hypothetical protein
MKHDHGLPAANTLSDEKQSAWIAGMKAWEKENPLDKPARNSPAFGIAGAVVGAMLIVAGLKLNDIESYLSPLLGIPFGYAVILSCKPAVPEMGHQTQRTTQTSCWVSFRMIQTQPLKNCSAVFLTARQVW